MSAVVARQASRFLAGPVLGVETSCDETAAGVVAAGQVLSARFASQIPLHRRFGGVVPEVASRNHLLSILPTIDAALADAGLRRDDLHGIAVTNRPGLIGALLVGVQTAATLAAMLRLPLVAVHHIEAHCWAALLDRDDDAGDPGPALPALALAVSGGHTSVLRIDDATHVQVLGETLDDAAGEAFDKVGKRLGLPYPAGPHVERLAAAGDPRRFALPHGMRGRNDLALSFSGLKTAARQLIDGLAPPGGDLQPQDVADLCAALQDAIVRQLTDVCLRAVEQTGLRDVIVGGGVAANRTLRDALAAALAAQGARCWPVAPRLCGDNGAMVAGLGSSLLAAGQRDDPFAIDAEPSARPGSMVGPR